jgi:hypothetical protein
MDDVEKSRPPFRTAARIRYLMVGGVLIGCLVLRLWTSDLAEQDTRGPIDLARVFFHMADDLVGWLGGTALGALVALVILDRWNIARQRAEEDRRAQAAREREREQERTHSRRISKQVRLTLADLRHGLKLLTLAMVETDQYDLVSDCFMGMYYDVVAVEDPPNEASTVRSALNCAAERAVEISDQFVKERHAQEPQRAMGVVVYPPPDSLDVGQAVAFIQNAQKQTDLVDEGASWCMTSVHDLDNLLIERPFEMLASGATLHRAARLWRQHTDNPITRASLAREEKPSTLGPADADTYGGLRSLSATILTETLYLYDEAARLLHEYSIQKGRESGEGLEASSRRQGST